MTRSDRAAIDHDGWPVQSGHGHYRSRHVLVAPRDRNQCIIVLRTAHGFNRVGDYITTYQGIAHAVGTVGNTITHTDRVEDESHHIVFPHAFFNDAGEFIQVHVAGVAIPAHAGHTHLGFGQVFVGESDAVQHRLGCWLCRVLRDRSAVSVDD